MKSRRVLYSALNGTMLEAFVFFIYITLIKIIVVWIVILIVRHNNNGNQTVRIGVTSRGPQPTRNRPGTC